MNYETRRVMFSSKHGYHRTPQDLFNQLDEEFHFNLDVCADPDYPLKTEGMFYLTGENGLHTLWPGYTCFMNPPYQRGIIEKWLHHAEEQRQYYNALIVALLPARTDTNWWWDYCLDKEVRIIKGRVKFSGMTTGAPFPSCIVIFKP